MHGLAEKLSTNNVKWLEGNPGVKGLNCSEYYGDSFHFGGKKGVVIKESVYKKEKIFNNSKLVCQTAINTDDIDKPLIHVKEEVVINGVNVSIYHSDGSGSIGGGYQDKKSWSSRCKKDSMTDHLFCNINDRNANIHIFKSNDGYSAFAGGEQYHGSPSYVRIDDLKPFEAKYEDAFTTDESKKIIDALMEGRQVKVRYTNMQYRANIDAVIDVEYFPIAKEVLDLIYDNHI